MIGQLIKGSFIYTVFNTVSGFLSFLLIPILTSYLSVEAYGIYDYLVVLGTLISYILALEINQSIGRFINIKNNNESANKEIISTAFLFTACTYFIFNIFIFIFKKTISNLLFNTFEYSNLIFLASLSYSSYAIIIFIVNQLKWEVLPIKSGTLKFVYSLSSLLIAIFLIHYFKKGVYSVFLGNIFGAMLSLPLAYHFTKLPFNLIFSFQRLKQMILFSLPLVFSSIAFFFSSYIDRIMISKLLNLFDLGIYSVAFRISSLILIIIVGLQSSLGPLIYKNYSDARTKDNLSIIFRVFIVLTLFLVSFFSIFSADLVSLITTDEFSNSKSLIPILTLTVLLSQAYIFFPGLWIEKKTKLIATINISGAILNAILNFILIKFLGLSGAAISTLIATALIFLVTANESQKIYYFPVPIKKIFFSFLVFFSFLLLITYFESNTNFYLKIIEFIFLALALNFSGLVSKAEKIKIKNSLLFFITK
jgi:O-antigen/teichoic acid export membrane protein